MQPGWQNWAGRCFYMSTGTKNWWDAKQDCIRRGGRLFEPRNKESIIIDLCSAKLFWLLGIKKFYSIFVLLRSPC